MSELKYDCELIQDLLPLYQDGVCSNSSRNVVEEHLQDCGSCREVAQKLKNCKVDEMLSREKETVLTAHEKKERRRTLTAGIVTAGILMIPVIVCLICNIAIGHGLDWFFIVLAAMLLTASLTVLPLLVQNRRWIWTIGGAVCSLLLLLLVCCIYSRGNWFGVAAVSSVLGISVFLAPYVICNIPLPKALADKKGLLVMGWDTIWLYGLIGVCGAFVQGGGFYWRVSLLITTYCLWLPWFIFGICRYLKANTYVKAGLIVIAAGVFTAVTNSVIEAITGIPNGGNIFEIELTSGYTSGNITGIMLAAFGALAVITGVGLVIAGLIRKKKNVEDEKK